MSQTTTEKTIQTTNALAHTETTRKGHPKRRRFTAFERTVVIAASLRFLATFSALLAFTLNKATPSPDVPIVAAISLLTVALFVSRARWAPLVCIPLAAYVVYNTFSNPFVLFDLANPKGPNGGQGYPLFIADVLALGSTLMILGCAIGAAVENYRQGNSGIRSWYAPGMLLVTGCMIGALFIGTLAAPSGGTTTYTNGVPTVHMGAGGFNQPSITISKGSKLLLVNDSSVEHVFFNGSWQNGNPVNTQEAGAPVINNISLKSGSLAIGPFTTAGTFHIYCSVHQGMNLTVIVQ